ncbi:MAG: hypothetical protein ACTHZI_01510 [Luteimonas sp.]
MSTKDQRSPVVITVRPTSVTVRRRKPETVVIRTGGPEPESVTDWNSRFTPAVVTGGGLAIATWLASFAVSYVSPLASFWIVLFGLLATGAAIYRELFRAELIPHWIVGAFIALAPFLLTSAINLLPFFAINRLYVAVIGLGLATSAAAHCLGLLKLPPYR